MRTNIKARVLFLQEMEKKLSFIDNFIQEYADQEHVEMYGLQIYRFFSSWKNSAPMFGYAEIGEIAGKLETIWHWLSIPASGAPVTKSILIKRIEDTCAQSMQMLKQLNLERSLRANEMDHMEDPRDVADLSSKRQQRILVVDDDPLLRMYISQNLRLEGYITDEAKTVEEAKKLIRNNTYQLVTVDLIMEPISGFELFEFMKSDPSLKWIPIVVLSGRNDTEDKIRCFRLGADDYVTKPFEIVELVARINRILERSLDFDRMAFRDPLTGIYNRRFMDIQLEMETKRKQRYGEPLVLGYIDIDRFKCFNDTYGHHIGDLILLGLAQKLQSLLRGSDYLSRFGGEEFVVVMPQTNAKQMKTTLDKVLDAVRQSPIAIYEGQEYKITFSAGVAEYDGKESVADWIARADAAMYRAKKEGRNQVCIYSNEEKLQPLQLPSKKALLVESDMVLRKILVSVMVRAGYEPYEAGDADTAHILLQSERFQVALIDIYMPNDNGLNLLHHVKNNPNSLNHTMKIMALSDQNNDDEMKKVYELGADDYLVKPFSLIELDMRVKQLFEDKPAT